MHFQETTSGSGQSQGFLQWQNPQSPILGKLEIEVFKGKGKNLKNSSNVKRVSRKCHTVKSCKICLVSALQWNFEDICQTVRDG